MKTPKIQVVAHRLEKIYNARCLKTTKISKNIASQILNAMGWKQNCRKHQIYTYATLWWRTEEPSRVGTGQSLQDELNMKSYFLNGNFIYLYISVGGLAFMHIRQKLPILTTDLFRPDDNWTLEVCELAARDTLKSSFTFQLFSFSPFYRVLFGLTDVCTLYVWMTTTSVHCFQLLVLLVGVLYFLSFIFG